METPVHVEAKQGIHRAMQQRSEQIRALRKFGILAEEVRLHCTDAINRYPVANQHQELPLFDFLLQVYGDSGIQLGDLNELDGGAALAAAKQAVELLGMFGVNQDVEADVTAQIGYRLTNFQITDMSAEQYGSALLLQQVEQQFPVREIDLIRCYASRPNDDLIQQRFAEAEKMPVAFPPSARQTQFRVTLSQTAQILLRGIASDASAEKVISHDRAQEQPEHPAPAKSVNPD